MKNSDSDDKLKKLLNEMPEDSPSPEAWEAMRENLVRENVIKGGNNHRRVLIFFLAMLLILGSYRVYNYQSPSLLFTGGGKDSAQPTSNKRVASNNTSVASNNTKEASEISESVRAEEMASIEASNSKTNRDYQSQGTVGMKKEKVNANPVAGSVATNHKKIPSNFSAKTTTKTEVSPRNSKPRSDDQPSPTTAERQSGQVTREPVAKESALIGAGNSEQATQPQAIGEQAKTESQTTAPVSNDVVVTQEQALVDPAGKDSTASASEKTEPVLTANIEEKKDSAPPQNAKKRIWAGAYLAWDYNYYKIKNNSNVLAVSPEELPGTGSLEGENGPAQFTIGFMGGYQFGKHWMAEAGIFYSQKKKVDSKLYAPASAQTGAYSSQEAYSDYIYHYTAHYLELGARIKYYPFLINNPYYITGGAIASFNFPGSVDSRGSFTNVSYSSSGPAQTDVITMSGSSSSLSLAVSIGKEIVIGKQWRMFVEPSYKYALDPVIKHPTYDKVPAEHYWRSISIGAGLMYDF